MIDGLRRRLSRSIERDPWDTEQELQELEPEVEEVSEIPTETAVLSAAKQAAPGFSPGEWSLTDYYKSMVKTALQNGGKYGNLRISTPWLGMILAGLENKPIEAEAMWYAAELDAPADGLPDIPSYNDLFPSDRNVSPGPR